MTESAGDENEALTGEPEAGNAARWGKYESREGVHTYIRLQ